MVLKRTTTAISPEILASVRRIEIRTRRLVEEVFSGEYHSVFKGTGMEFREVREYVAGDDIRSIDWNVTARTGDPFVKLFEEERELTVMLVVDMSRSGWFGSGERTKVEVAAELCGVLAFSAIANKDKVGLVLFSDRVEKYIPPAKGKSHVLRLIRELLTFTPEGHGTDINEPLRLLGSVLKRKATVFLVSDFWAGVFTTSLSVLGRRHDVVAVRVRDPRETTMPDVGLVRWVDAESGQSELIDTSSAETGRQLALRVQAHDGALAKTLASRGVDVVDVDVTTSYVEPLRKFFLAREGRSGRKGRR
ncbi:MAG: DUF58 domain-containing protein [Candidatus Krumholzibacteria bacterium]|nr:DUF58 domain-containing protein [Candidatus Krumholzibacteria bacterium]